MTHVCSWQWKHPMFNLTFSIIFALKVVRFCLKSNYSTINVTMCARHTNLLLCNYKGTYLPCRVLYYLLLLNHLASCGLGMRPILSPVVFIHKNALKLLQLTVALHLSFLMELWATRTQLRGQRHTITVMMGLPWRERWQQYAEQITDGAPLQFVDLAQVVVQ